MTLSDAVLVLLLAERIHGTNDAVRRAGKNVVKKLPRSKRDILYDLIDSPNAVKLIHHIAANLED
ncbi:MULTISPECIES: hypothetical protein [Pseudomonas chlororaphis group]|uniref:DUF7740 domain-containing protein n=1 Tax=Pseudomonas chlororaphis group TaxID=136842 RepID=UPI0020974D03|nr:MULTISPECIES: hypothetical protein [Pseudomonas chlororaphis group]MCO7575750.1 hypothetical protein [Pseudomonas protegens]MCO7581412.1 hypothetical protein [Pseudomonas chlororaphis]MCO7597563.1 hypothetical protein [Pseudomonas chlororaphis]